MRRARIRIGRPRSTVNVRHRFAYLRAPTGRRAEAHFWRLVIVPVRGCVDCFVGNRALSKSERFDHSTLGVALPDKRLARVRHEAGSATLHVDLAAGLVASVRNLLAVWRPTRVLANGALAAEVAEVSGAVGLADDDVATAARAARQVVRLLAAEEEGGAEFGVRVLIGFLRDRDARVELELEQLLALGSHAVGRGRRPRARRGAQDRGDSRALVAGLALEPDHGAVVARLRAASEHELPRVLDLLEGRTTSREAFGQLAPLAVLEACYRRRG